MSDPTPVDRFTGTGVGDFCMPHVKLWGEFVVVVVVSFYFSVLNYEKDLFSIIYVPLY